MRLPVFATFPASLVGLSWQSIAIDRSQGTFAAGMNLNTISRGDGGGSIVGTRWSAKVGAGPEAAAMQGGMLCNAIGAVSWRALQYSIPLRSGVGGIGNVSYSSNLVTLDVLMTATAAANATGVFLMQTDGTTVGTELPGTGVGFGFRIQPFSVDCWCSSLGVVATVPSDPTLGLALRRCTLQVRSSRLGQAGAVSWLVDGVPAAAALLPDAVGVGPNQGYAAGRYTYWPIVSAGAGTLYVAELSVLSSEPGDI